MRTLIAVVSVFIAPFALIGLALRRSRRPPPAKALRLLLSAMDIAEAYQNDSGYIPTEEELAIFWLLQESMLRNAHIASMIVLRLGERRRGLAA